MTEKEIYDHLMSRNMFVLYSLRGSQLYGTNIETSDFDYHGIFMYPNGESLSLYEPTDNFQDSKGDVVFFEMKKYFRMAMSANPTVLEIMFTPNEFVKIRTDISDLIIKNRSLFVTKKCYYSFNGYAFNQCVKAVGKNKKVHGKDKYFNKLGFEKLRSLLENDVVSPEWIEQKFSKHFLQFLLKNQSVPVTSATSFKQTDEVLIDDDIRFLLPPRHVDYCYFVKDTREGFPMRPVLLSETGIDLKKYNCSSMEHVVNVFRLYFYDQKANGIFKDGKVVCSSIPIEDEVSHFSGLLIYANNEYESAKKDWKSYFEWMSERNESRWKESDEKEFSFDHKNMQHLVRLLLSGENIAREGEPIIRFSGDKLKFLREIREGKYTYDYVMKFANEKMQELQTLFEKSLLPDGCDKKKVCDLYDEIVSMNGW